MNVADLLFLAVLFFLVVAVLSLLIRQESVYYLPRSSSVKRS